MSDLDRSVADIRRSLHQDPGSEPVAFTVPDHWLNVLSNEAARRYLDANHCLGAYTSRRCDLRYDPRLNRVVFLVKRNGQTVDAVGRLLGRADPQAGIPKWLRYGRSELPFVCGEGEVAVLVEDAASACAVSELAAGVALLGTELTDGALSVLRGYNRVVIALDPDATRKAMDMQHRLAFYTDAAVRWIPDDLKFYNTEDIGRILRLDEAFGQDI